MVTIKDVAKYANVSVATVSRVIRGVGYFSEETNERVQKACDELGYIANSTAQRLKSKNIGAVGYVISDINNPYYIEIAAELQRLLSKEGVELILAFSSENPTDETQSFRYLISAQVNTILFTPSGNKNEEIIRKARQNGIKVIQLFRKIYDDLDAVYNDDENGCFDAANYLVNCGKKRILLLDVEYPYVDYSCVTPSRSAGLCRAINGEVQTKVVHVGISGSNYDLVSRAIGDFRPDAVIASTGLIALDVLQYIKSNNVELELVSFDDNRWLETLDVSAIRHPSEQTAETIVSLIDDDTTLPRTIVVKQTLVERKK